MRKELVRAEGAVTAPRGLALAAWALGWAALFMLDAQLDLANKALILVLAAAVAALGSGPWMSMATSTASVLAFNVCFVPPRGALSVDLHQHALLLTVLLAVSWIVTLLVARLRWHAAQATLHAQRSDQLRDLGEALRAVDTPAAQAVALQSVLLRCGADCVVRWGGCGPDDAIGVATADQEAGLRLCLQSGQAMGPGTGRHEHQPDLYLPLRGLHAQHGALLVQRLPVPETDTAWLAHLQALADQLGAALERTAALRAAEAAREQAQAQTLRNTFLTAIAHDHRTPLATILGAASALQDQAERQSPAQRRQLAGAIVEEATQLARLTENTLQLARLGLPGLPLQRDWQSAEELVGPVLRRVRRRAEGQRVKLRIEPGLPLLRCDAVLIVQLLDNLVDNALKHAGEGAAVELLARRRDDTVVLAVRDRGPGVPPAWRERIFEAFMRGDERAAGAGRGAGVGLALCRAIARVHGGELRLRARSHGGASFELVLPLDPAPPGPDAAASEPAP